LGNCRKPDDWLELNIDDDGIVFGMARRSNVNLRVGIVGFGKMGQIRAVAAEKSGRCDIARVFDLNLPDNPPYPVAQSIDAIVADPAIDAVYVCLPNFLNKSTTITALQAGKHVFCEKPPAFNAADVEEIVATEKASGKVLMYGFNHRHHAGVMKMKALIDSGAYGKVLWMRGRYGKSVDSDYLSTWRTKKELAGGGILLDQGIHMLDLFHHMGDCTFDEVHALVSSRYWNMPGIEDNVFLIMRNRDTGLEVSFHSTMTQWRHLFSLEVFMEQGYMVLNGLKTASNSYGAEELSVAKNRSVAPAASWETETKEIFDHDESWEREAEIFVNAIAGTLPLSSGTSEQALTVMRLIDRIYRSDRFVSKKLYDDLR
jgi:1,5-anhydro-D-fructose reductase (1,5-anhydro-D-mannitol-forming)